MLRLEFHRNIYFPFPKRQASSHILGEAAKVQFMLCVVESLYQDYGSYECKIWNERNNAVCFVVNEKIRDDNYYHLKTASFSERSISVQLLNSNAYL